MTPTEILVLIQSDPTAMELAGDGNDDGCAARLMVIVPAAPVSKRVTEIDMMENVSLANAEECLVKIDTAASTNPIVARMRKWLQPGAAGVDFSLGKFRSLLTNSVASGGCGMTAAQAKRLTDLTEAKPVITAAMVGEAMRPLRT